MVAHKSRRTTKKRNQQYTSTQARTRKGISTPTRISIRHTTHDTETRKQNSEITPRTHGPMHCFSRGLDSAGFFPDSCFLSSGSVWCVCCFLRDLRVALAGRTCGFQPSFKFWNGGRLQMETCDTSDDHALSKRSVGVTQPTTNRMGHRKKIQSRLC